MIKRIWLKIFYPAISLHWKNNLDFLNDLVLIYSFFYNYLHNYHYNYWKGEGEEGEGGEENEDDDEGESKVPAVELGLQELKALQSALEKEAKEGGVCQEQFFFYLNCSSGKEKYLFIKQELLHSLKKHNNKH